MPKIILLKAMRAVNEFELTGALSIGRHESNDIQLDEERASRLHCRILLENEQALLEDLDSANGVYLNGLKIKSAVLSNNDRITVGGTTLLYAAAPAVREVRGGDTVVLREAIKLPPAEKPAPTKDALHKTSAAPKARARSRVVSKHPFAALVGLLASAALFCVALYFLWHALNAKPDVNDLAERTSTAKHPAGLTPSISMDPLAIEQRPKKADAPLLDHSAQDARLNERLKTALAQRDRALASGNFLTAKAALRSFLNSLSAGDLQSAAALSAQREAGETERVIHAAFELELAQARDALKARHFQIFVQRCTALLSNDPQGPFGAQARELLEGLDERTAPLAAAAKTSAHNELVLGHLEPARVAVENALGELSGTRWGGDISALHLQLIMATGLLDEMETARAKKSAAGETLHVAIAAKNIDGELLKLSGLSAQLQSGAATLPVNLNGMTTPAFARLLEQLGLRERHAELACLWTLLGRAEDAYVESEAALKNPGSAPLAACLAGMLANASNLHLYDFSGWRQQADWDALSGNWMTQNEKYVLMSADGGETVLKESSLGGAFPLDGARLNFEFEILQPAPGWFFACEFGGAEQGVSLQFAENELSLSDKSGAKTQSALTLPGTPPAAHVEVVIEGDKAEVRLGGKPVLDLQCPGLSRVKGTVGFQARQCACSLDNVILRTQQAQPAK